MGEVPGHKSSRSQTPYEVDDLGMQEGCLCTEAQFYPLAYTEHDPSRLG